MCGSRVYDFRYNQKVFLKSACYRYRHFTFVSLCTYNVINLEIFGDCLTKVLNTVITKLDHTKQ